MSRQDNSESIETPSVFALNWQGLGLKVKPLRNNSVRHQLTICPDSNYFHASNKNATGMLNLCVTAVLVTCFSLSGLCGNWNGKGGDDLMKPDGTQAENINAFGHSWQVCISWDWRTGESCTNPLSQAANCRNSYWIQREKCLHVTKFFHFTFGHVAVDIFTLHYIFMDLKV